MQLHATQRSHLNYANQVEGHVKTQRKELKYAKQCTLLVGPILEIFISQACSVHLIFEPLYHKIKLIFLTLISTLKFGSTKFCRWADLIQEKNVYLLYEQFIFKTLIFFQFLHCKQKDLENKQSIKYKIKNTFNFAIFKQA